MHRTNALILLTIATNSSVILCYLAIKSVIILLHAKKNQPVSIPSSIRFPSILAILLYCSASISSLCFMYHIFISPHNWVQPTGLISFSTWLFAGSLLAFIFMRRLKYSFKDTKYSYNKCVLTTLNIMILFYPILWIIILVLRILVNITFDDLKYTINIISGLIFLFWIGYHAIYSTIVLCLFQNKLMQLIKSYFISFCEFEKNKLVDPEKSQGKTESDSSCVTASNVPALQKSIKKPTNMNKTNEFCNVRSDSIQLEENRTVEIETISNRNTIATRTDSLKKVKQFDHKKLELINNMTRYTLLVSICGITSLLVICEMLVVTKGVDGADSTLWLQTLFYYQLAINIDSFINGLCLYLFFPFASKTYGTLCKHPHRIFANCCGKCIDYKIMDNPNISMVL